MFKQMDAVSLQSRGGDRTNPMKIMSNSATKHYNIELIHKNFNRGDSLSHHS
jgi:hypothetical protein